MQEVEEALVNKYIDQFIASLGDVTAEVFDEFLSGMPTMVVTGYGDTQWMASTTEFHTTVDRGSLRSAISDLIYDSVAEMAREAEFVRKLKAAENKWLQFAADEYTKRAEAEAAAAKATTAAETKAPADGVKMEEN